MLVFVDFEASSLSKRSYPIEVGWAFEDGRGEGHLICPAPDWTDWDAEAERIHGISRGALIRDGEPHDTVASRMIAELTGHDLYATAPSWDGKWLSVLLRAAGRPRHSLRLRDSDDAHRDAAAAVLSPVTPAEALARTVAEVLTMTKVRAPGRLPAHRALADAREELQRHRLVCDAARDRAEPSRSTRHPDDRPDAVLPS